MKKKIYPVLLFTVSLWIPFLGSCRKEWLESKSNLNQAVPSSLKDLQALMDGSITINNFLIGFGEVAADGHYVTENAFNAANNTAKNVYTWSHTYPYRNVLNWSLIYSRIFYTNVVLDGLSKLNPETDRTNFDFIRGQALFNRAAAFWSISQHFCGVYKPGEPNSEPGIPLRLNSDVSEISKRSTIRESYAQIIQDLRTAVNLLPYSVPYPTRPDKAAGFAMLARTFLSMSEYDSAAYYADRCLELESQLMDFNTLPKDKNFIGIFPKEVLYHDQLYTSGLTGLLTTNYLFEPSFVALYEEDDLRKTLYFRVSNGNCFFKGNYSNSTSGLFGGLATDEIYLIRAEARVRLGDIAGGIEDLNILLRSRWKTNPDGQSFYIEKTADNQLDALRIILLERRKELVLRGVRWSDLRRLNREDAFKTVIVREVAGQTFTLHPGGKGYVFPFPDDVIEKSGMQQNGIAVLENNWVNLNF